MPGSVISFTCFICLFPSAPSLTPSKVKTSFCSQVWPYLRLQLYVCQFCVNPQTSSANTHLFIPHQLTVEILHLLLSLNFKFFLCRYGVYIWAHAQFPSASTVVCLEKATIPFLVRCYSHPDNQLCDMWLILSTVLYTYTHTRNVSIW